MPNQRTRRRAIAVFLLFTFLTDIFAPAISFALTSGPTSPEATSFEPVDTTDMVNLATGDLVYNLSLMEVPGTSGGYPLSLSYHAGIQPDVDASWCGLGFTLNPGAISRFVNGYADDHREAVITDHFSWSGATKTTYTIGVSVPVTSGASATAGLSFTQDSHHGFSVNPYAGGTLEITPGVSINASSNGVAQISAPGLQYLNMIQNQNATVGLGRLGTANISKKGITTNTQLLGPFSLDMSINSKGIKPKLSVAGFEKGVSREGKINTESSSITIPIPLGTSGAFLTLGRSYMRRWIDEHADVNTNGALYFPQTKPDYTYLNARSFDTYDLNTSIATNVFQVDPEKSLDGSFADYDHFAVNAQGLTGSIKPYHLYEYLYRQNRANDGTAITRCVPLGATGNRPGFRFDNDFSNRFLFEPPAPSYFSGSMSMIFPTESITAGMAGEGYANNILAGSKHIEYFTNSEIVNDLAGSMQRGFIDGHSVGFTRSASASDKLGDQIGAFSITNESGVTYHFALPVYAWAELTRIDQITQINGEINQVVEKPTRYAHTWHLTAVTGPDYVDRGGPGGAANGKIDKEDWGYWVEFGYRQWSAIYRWRNPVQGFNPDLDNNFQTYTRGNKEIYYLDYIRTNTHIAIFDKSRRWDGRGMGPDGFINVFEHSQNGSVARLDRIFLLDYKDLESRGGLVALDNMNIHRAFIEQNSIRSLKFNYDYSLCPQTVNSFADPVEPSDENIKKGKLTLNSLEFRGKSNANSLPPIQFSYEVKDPAETSLILEKASERFWFQMPNSSRLQEGDIVRFANNGNTYYGLIKRQPSFVYELIIIDGDASTLSSGTVTVSVTKNPPYNKEKYDMWRLYKSDFMGNEQGEARLTTTLSAKNVDVWSLRSIRTMMGSEINVDYETDYYDEVVLNRGGPSGAGHQALRIRNAARVDADKLRIFFYNDGYDLNEIFDVGEEVDVTVMGGYFPSDLTLATNPPAGCICPSIGYAHHQNFDHNGGTVASVSQAEYAITVTSEGLISTIADDEVDVVDRTTLCNNGDYRACSYAVSNSWPSFIAGGIVIAQNKPKWGGGIRVKKIAVNNLFKTFITSYNYLHGVTSYEPVSVPPFKLRPDYYNINIAALKAQEFQEAALLHKSAVMRRYSRLMSIAREVPGPGVMYKEVEMRTSVKDVNGEHPNQNWQKFAFQTFTYGMVGYTDAVHSIGGIPGQPPPISGLSYKSLHIKSVQLNDLTTAIGNIKSITTYDLAGNPIESTEHSYLHDEYLGALESNGHSPYANAVSTKFQSQGVVVESFADSRLVRQPQGSYGLLGITSKKRMYPSILTKSRYKNLKTGVETTNEIQAFDFFSGETTKAVYKDQYGNAYVHATEPAYRKYQNMGLGMYGRKNMLTQAAADYVYKVNPTNTAEQEALVSANVQTWSDQVPVQLPGALQPVLQSDIWRKHASYSFTGLPSIALRADGLYPVTQLPLFPWSTNDPGPEWQKNVESTRYDVYSHDLEASDVNNNKMAVKMSYDHTKVLAAVSNAGYDEFAYSGAEETGRPGRQLGGGVYLGEDALLNTSRSHTGEKCIVGGTGVRTFNYQFTPEQKTYRVSVWTYLPGISIKYKFDAQNPISATTKTAYNGNWWLYYADIPVTASYGNMEIWCESFSGNNYFDDFRVHPVDASMTSYVYNQWGELSHILSGNNLFTRFEYDAMGRLKETYKETLTHGVVKINDVQYQYSSGN